MILFLDCSFVNPTIIQPSATHGTPVTQYTIEMCPVDGKFVPMFTGKYG